MYKRILVPLDGSTVTEAAEKPALPYVLSDPSAVSSLVNGLEAIIESYEDAITWGLLCEGIYTFSLLHENRIADTLLAVADAMEVDRITTFTSVPEYNAR